jgi:hypothetical protein
MRGIWGGVEVPMTKARKVPITARALLQRINRRLAKDDEMIRKSRPSYDREGYPHYDHNVGEYYRINTNRNWMVESDVSLEATGRELGVMAEWEALGEASEAERRAQP